MCKLKEQSILFESECCLNDFCFKTNLGLSLVDESCKCKVLCERDIPRLTPVKKQLSIPNTLTDSVSVAIKYLHIILKLCEEQS